MKWIRFSRDMKLGEDRYFSRTWYQVDNKLAQSYLDDYPDLAIQVVSKRPGEEVLAGRPTEYMEEVDDLEELAEEALDELMAAEEAVAAAAIEGESVEGDDNADVPLDEEGEDDDPEVEAEDVRSAEVDGAGEMEPESDE